MYSYEDRMRAVQLYIKLDKRVAATIRQLGYPTKNSLKGWHREYEQDRDLKPVLVRAPKFTEEQKAWTVAHCLTHGRCVAFTIKALGYPGRASLHAWIQELNPRARHACLAHRRMRRSTRPCLHCVHVRGAHRPSLTIAVCAVSPTRALRQYPPQNAARPAGRTAGPSSCRHQLAAGCRGWKDAAFRRCARRLRKDDTGLQSLRL